MNQMQLADKLGVKNTTVSTWECGRATIPVAYRAALTDIFGSVEGFRFTERKHRSAQSDNALLKAREDAGLTQAQLAKALGVSIPLVSLWENGHVEIPIAYKDALQSVLDSVDGIEFSENAKCRDRNSEYTPLASARKAMRMTQKKLAELLGVPSGTVSLWEHGLHIPEKHVPNILAILGRGALGVEAKNRVAYTENDLTGKRFCRLTAVKALPLRDGGYVIWRCRCDCGNECNVSSRHLRTGAIKSCGCLKAENLIKTPIDEKLGLVENTNLSRIQSNRAQRNSSTGVRGVSKTKNGKYEAYVFFQKHKYRVGFFDTLEEAAMARIEAWNRICKPTLDKYDKHR